MARHESDREDLLREATALVERIELSIPNFADPIVCGFRKDGSASFYFGADPVYQFNTSSQLRRAFVNGRLLKAEHGRLVALSRTRTEHEVALVRHELAAQDLALLLMQLNGHFEQLKNSFQAGEYSVIGQVPPEANIVERIALWLEKRPRSVEIAAAPNAR
jgi:hypothetical protein